MKLLVLSDLHLDIWNGKHPKTDLEFCKPDVVILAGDIHGNAKAVKWASETFEGIDVLYVHGNHEAYGREIAKTQRNILDACDETPNVTFLNGDQVIIGDVRFIGATLWTDFCLFGIHTKQQAMFEAERYMNDYKAIRLRVEGGEVYYRKLRATDTGRFHAKQRAYIQSKIEEPFDGKTVVITHMAPSMRSVPERYLGDIVSAAYASDLELMARQVDVWIHGHTHDSWDYDIGKCRVVCNPCGYPYLGGGTENVRFDPNLIIEI